MNATAAAPSTALSTAIMPPASQALAPVSARESDFNLAQRTAKAMASSTLVPDTYRGNVANVLIAMEVANRIGASPFLVMQNLYIVQGRPSWSSQFLIATVNACKRFSPLRFEIEGGDDPSAKTFKCRAVAKDLQGGESCVGPWITWKMVDAEGWAKKAGSKWQSIPDLMFRYRAAGFWTRLFAPELSMGILTREEVEDVWGGSGAQPSAPTDTGNIRTLEAQLRGEDPPPADAAPVDDDRPEFNAQNVHDAMASADTLERLDDVASVIGDLPEADRDALREFWRARRVELTTD
jgi:hypothetical protein